MSRDLTCNETMSVMDDTESKDPRRFFQPPGTMSSRMPTVSGLPNQISRPVLKTLRSQTSSQLMNSSPGISQKAHLLNSVATSSAAQPSTSQFGRTFAPKASSTRPSSAMGSHSLFKPFHTPAEAPVSSGATEMTQPMAVIYQQIQEEQHRQQLRLSAVQQQSAFSLPHSRESFEQRTFANAASIIGNLDSRYFNPAASTSRLRPAVSRSSTPSQQMLNPVSAINSTLRLTPQSRSVIGIVDPNDSSRSPSNRVASHPTSGLTHVGEADILLSSQEKHLSNTLANLTSSATTSNPSTSTVNQLLPNSRSSNSPQLNNAHSSPHPGPSPRPSILRKIRDPTAGNSSAVRRLAFDTPVSRPSSCSDTISSSSSVNDDSASFLAKFLLTTGGRHAIAPATIDGVSRVLSTSDPNVRNAQSALAGNVTPAESAFERVEGSPQHNFSDLDTPRKRMRKQQFDSTQAPDKIKMEVSVQLDTNKIGVQKEEIPLWKLAPPGQPPSNSTSSKGNDKVVRRRGRPRTDSKVEATTFPSTSYIDVDTNSSESSKPKKSRKQVPSSGSDASTSENVNPSAALGTAIGAGKSLSAGLLNLREACDAENAAARSLRNLLQTLQQNRDQGLSSFESHSGGTSATPESDASFRMAVAAVRNELAKEAPIINGTAEIVENDRGLKIDASKMPLLLDGSENSSELSPIETGYASPTILASIGCSGKPESSSQSSSALDRVTDIFANRSRPHLNNLGAAQNIRFNHFSRVESVKTAAQKVKLLKAAKRKFQQHQKLNGEQRIKERLELKHSLLEKPRCAGDSEYFTTECALFEKLSDVSSEVLQTSTADFFEELNRVYRNGTSCLQSGSDSGLSVSEEVLKRQCNLCDSPYSLTASQLNLNCLQAHVAVVPSDCQASTSSGLSCSRSNGTLNHNNNWKNELTVVAGVLADMIDKVTVTCEKPRSDCRLKDVRDGSLNHASTSTATSLDQLSNESVKRNCCIKTEMKEEYSEGGRPMWFNNDEEWDEYIGKEMDKIEGALRMLGRDDEVEEVDSKNATLGCRRLVSTYDALRRAKVNEAENADELLNVFLGFLRTLDNGVYEQLNEDAEMLYDPEDDAATRKRKRLGLIQTFVVQLPRARPMLKKSMPYIPSASTNFRPSSALVDDIFAVKRLPERKSWSEGDRSFFVNRRLDRGKERSIGGRHSGEFNVEAELEGTDPNYLPSILKDLYEQHTGSFLTRLRLDVRIDRTPSTAEMVEHPNHRNRPNMEENKGEQRNKELTQRGSLQCTGYGAFMTNDLSDQHKLHDKVLKSARISALTTGNLVCAGAPNHAVTSGVSDAYNLPGKYSKEAQSTSRPLTRADRAHIRRRMRNIREQVASLLQTLRTNAMLASTALEVYDGYSEDLLAEVLPSARTESESDAGSEHSMNEDDAGECLDSVETPASISLPPSP